MDYSTQTMTLDPEGAWVRWSDIDLHDQFYAVTLHQRNTAWVENQSLRDALIQARLQLEYLDGKFPSTGTTSAVLGQIRAALASDNVDHATAETQP
jgi:hypothetical protein